MRKILVTGISGFIGSHCALDLLSHGYAVRGSLRDLSRADSVREMLARHGADTSRLEFTEASLTDWAAWPKAAEGCDGIFHIASPVPTIQPKNVDELIAPARDGTLNVLAAARQAGIKRVVQTSSVAAIFGGISEDRLYTSEDWSDPADPDLNPYALSKTIAEKAAWDFCAENGLSLSTINPAMVLGPALEADYGSSLEAITKLMRREVPLLPRFGFEIVDVRDVASLHRLVFDSKEAIGQRFIAANGFRWFREIASTLNSEFPDYQVPQREMPNWLTRLTGVFIKEIGSFINDLDLAKQLDIEPARKIGWQPRVPEEAILSGARSLVALGVL